MTYERTVAAAVAETKSKFALAEALAEDIPPRGSGPNGTGEADVKALLAEAAQAIAVAGGELRSVSTLDKYRLTALWVKEPNSALFRWVEGVSFSAHTEARQAGMDFEGFAVNPMNVRQIRGIVGAASKDGPPEKIAESWTPEQKASVARELLAQPEIAAQVVTDKQARATVSRATDEYHQRQASERADRTERKAAEDGTDRRVDALLWVNRLGEAAERFAREGNEALRHVGPLPESERYWLTGAIDRAEATARASRRYLELGKSEFDSELETLLANGA